MSLAVVVLAIAEVLLVLVSWLLSATMTDGVRSLLSSEGVRWFFGSFATMLATPLLVWLVLLSMAFGCMQGSGLASVLLCQSPPTSYRERVALRGAAMVLVAYAAMLFLLTAVPHAVLLSATGRLFPSVFSRALPPVVAFGIALLSSVYGLLSGRFLSVYDIADALCRGLAAAAPLFLFYVFAAQFWQSACFVFL